MSALLSVSLVLVSLVGADRIDEVVKDLRPALEEPELPLDDLLVDPDRGTRSVSTAEARYDVERLFRILRQGYSGYAYFGGAGAFDPARSGIREELATRTKWSPRALAELIRRHLEFVRDFHTSIGGVRYGTHRDWWFDSEREFRSVDGRIVIDLAGAPHEVVSIDGARLRPSLNRSGRAILRIGTLALEPPGRVRVVVSGPAGKRTIDLDLRRSRFRHFSRRVYREDRVGGIPVLRIRSFSDHHEESLRKFVEAARRMRGEPCVIVDVRGNGGGNERWVNAWVREMTGGTPRKPFIHSELVSRTSMAGRANYMAWLRHHNPDTEFYVRETKRFTTMARAIGPEGSAPEWTAVHRPDVAVIPNDTTIVIVTNGLVGSAGEGFVLCASQARNVVVVGENTRGALTFGNVSAHRLPNSGLMVQLPINFGLFPDLVLREETGLEPDWWVPAADAVNCAVAAVRAGTIGTVRPLTAEQRAAEFVPEEPENVDGLPRWLVVSILSAWAISGTCIALRYLRRRRSEG